MSTPKLIKLKSKDTRELSDHVSAIAKMGGVSAKIALTGTADQIISALASINGKVDVNSAIISIRAPSVER